MQKNSALKGYATPEGTGGLRKRFESAYPGHFRLANEIWISSVGLGTYLGNPDEATDDQYRTTVGRAFELGVNVIDTAINYRHQRSERSIGQALQLAVASGALRRDEVFVATKGGFLSFDGETPADPARYFQETFVRPGILRAEEVVSGCHAMTPQYLESQVHRSLENLQLETLDLYYVHNPETQLAEVDREEFHRRLRAAFAKLEELVGQGKIRAYGTATWNAYRVDSDAREALSIERVVKLAREVGGLNHHFRAVQLPFNLGMPEAIMARNQQLHGRTVAMLEAALELGLTVFASASLLQGQLSRNLPADVQRWFPGLATDAQRSLQFVRSVPGVACALVGMSRVEHLEENLGVARVPPLTKEDLQRVFS